METATTLDIPTSLVPSNPRPKGDGRRWARKIASGLEWTVGALALLVGLSALASFPVAQFLGLGYLLEASARVGRGGRVSDAWIGVRKAARVGGIVAGAWLSILPARFVSSMAGSAELIDPDGPLARGWRGALFAVAGLTAVHVASACARGGRLREFLWPIGTISWLLRRPRMGGLYLESRDATWEFVRGLRLPHYFRVGLVGFVGSACWLALPVALIAAGRRFPPLAILGGIGLGSVAMALPFLQVRFADEGRFGALFEVKAIRERYRRAPWAFALAFFLTVASSVPLYLLKIELVPREVAWLPGLVFVAFLAPARVACGWAYHRGGVRDRPRRPGWRWSARLAMVPIAFAYVLIVFLGQYTSWWGAWSLAEQHAFLLPVPFSGY